MNERWKGGWMKKPRQCGAIAWRRASALTDDGQPPLDASGLRLQQRLQAIDDSIERVAGKRGEPLNSADCSDLCGPD